MPRSASAGASSRRATRFNAPSASPAASARAAAVKIGTRKDWLAARLELLAAEKELTRRGDELARRRQELPWVRIDKKYRFETDEGGASLAEFFRGRSQLLIYHFMFGPDFKAGCATCSTIADGFNGFVAHLANHDVTLSAVSRAPLAKLQAYKRRMGWTFPWASSHDGDFNSDFSASFTEEQQRDGGIEYNYRREPAWQLRTDGGMANRMSGNPVADNAAMAGGWTPSGACTPGSTAPPGGATSPASGGAAATSTTARNWRHHAHDEH